MKKRILALCLALCLCLGAFPAQKARALSTVCFISLNDTLLELSSAAYTTGGTSYVPYTVFGSFGIYYTYFSDNSTVLLYTANKQLYFETGSGRCYDGNDVHYAYRSLYVNGQIYVPAAFVSWFLGLTYSYINGVGYGDILRIKNSSAELNDSQFLSAATLLMRDRYNAYVNATSTPPDTATPPAPPENGEEGPVTHMNTAVYLSFRGLPSDTVLKLLSARSVGACFFLTADDIREGADTVRRIIAEGSSVGVLCSDNVMEDYEEAAELVFEAARVKTLLVASSGNKALCAGIAAENGLVFWDYGLGNASGENLRSYYPITAQLERAEDRADICLRCDDNTAGILYGLLSYLISSSFELRRPRETDSIFQSE